MSALLAPSYLPAFSNAFAEGLRADRRLGICEWAEKEIRLVDGPEQGRLRLDRTPYLRGVLEAFTDPAIRDITLKTGSQVAKTTALMICLAYAIDQDPANAVWVMPTEDLAKEISKERIQPIFEKSPGVRRQMTGYAADLETVRLHFLRMTTFFAWAKSPASLSSRPARYIFLDETNKYPTFSGKEADPLKLATERTKTFWNKKILAASTPTTPDGTISVRYKQSDQRKYYVPCPQCGHKQLLITQSLKWPAGVTPDDIEADDLAWYECQKCREQLRDTDKHFMLANGEWIAENPAARRHAGFHLNTLCSPMVRWSEYAKEFLQCEHKPELLMNFTNSWEGTDFLPKAAPVTEESIAALKIPYTMGVVPMGAQLLTCGVDVQEDCAYYAVRAWGLNDESWLIDYGVFLRTKTPDGKWMEDDLGKIGEEIFATHYEHANGSRMQIRLCYADSGWRTDPVYQFASKHRHMCMAIKGDNDPKIESKDGNKTRGGKMVPQRLSESKKFKGAIYMRLNTTYYKDMLQGMREAAGKPWHIPVSVGTDYLSQISAEHKIIAQGPGGTRIYEWALREGYRDNHWFDCEVYALAAADQCGFRKMLPPEVAARMQPAKREPMRMPDGRPFFVGNR